VKTCIVPAAPRGHDAAEMTTEEAFLLFVAGGVILLASLALAIVSITPAAVIPDPPRPSLFEPAQPPPAHPFKRYVPGFR
jgi:hypothetical protein